MIYGYYPFAIVMIVNELLYYHNVILNMLIYNF